MASYAWQWGVRAHSMAKNASNVGVCLLHGPEHHRILYDPRVTELAGAVVVVVQHAVLR